MTNVILVGINGKMGQVILQTAKSTGDVKIVCGVDINGASCGEISVYTALDDVLESADVIIDFSHPSSLGATLDYAQRKGLACVIATTGFDASQKAMLDEYAKKIPVFFSANMSLGINLLIDLAKKAAAVLGNEFDIEIIEKHHNQKLDAPSGTALAIADALNEQAGNCTQYVFDRHSTRKKRSKTEIGIHSVRGGNIVGEHEVLFAGNDEMITITHNACSREIFAAGALRAAAYMRGKSAGMYSMSDLINAKEE